MPASSGLRTRPSFGLMRSGSLRRIHERRMPIGQSLRRIPMIVLAPFVIVAGLAAGFALNWTHTIHTEEMAWLESIQLTTGTVSIRN
jgi:hypothetical protein